MLALYRFIALYILMMSSAMGAGRSQYYCQSGGEIATINIPVAANQTQEFNVSLLNRVRSITQNQTIKIPLGEEFQNASLSIDRTEREFKVSLDIANSNPFKVYFVETLEHEIVGPRHRNFYIRLPIRVTRSYGQGAFSFTRKQRQFYLYMTANLTENQVDRILRDRVIEEARTLSQTQLSTMLANYRGNLSRLENKILTIKNTLDRANLEEDRSIRDVIESYHLQLLDKINIQKRIKNPLVISDASQMTPYIEQAIREGKQCPTCLQKLTEMKDPAFMVVGKSSSGDPLYGFMEKENIDRLLRSFRRIVYWGRSDEITEYYYPIKDVVTQISKDLN